MAPKKVVKAAAPETLAFANPSIVIAAVGVEGSKDYKPARVIKSQRGWPITTSEKYPISKFEQMLVDLATQNGGSAKLNMQVSINLTQKSDEPLDATGIELL